MNEIRREPKAPGKIPAPDKTLISALRDPEERIQLNCSQTCDLQNCEIINLCCFKLLNLWCSNRKSRHTCILKNLQETSHSMTNIENFPLRSRGPTFTISIQHSTGCLSKGNKTNKKEVKSIKIKNKWIEWALFIDYMTVDLDYSKEFSTFRIDK